MKKFLLICMLLTGCFLFASAQEEGKADGGRIEALKIAYLTNKLKLSPEEAQKFWPIYNQYNDDVRKLRTEQRLQKLPELTVEERMLNIRKKYNDEFSRALTSEKVNNFFRAEREFNGMLQKELLERRQQRLDTRRQKIQK